MLTRISVCSLTKLFICERDGTEVAEIVVPGKWDLNLVTRLVDMGVEPYLVSSSLIAIIAQRLVRRVCQDCKETARPSANELRELGIAEEAGREGEFFVGAGCDKCV